MPDKMAKIYRPWYVWLMRLAHFRWARVTVAVVYMAWYSVTAGIPYAWNEFAPNQIRDAKEGDWS